MDRVGDQGETAGKDAAHDLHDREEDVDPHRKQHPPVARFGSQEGIAAMMVVAGMAMTGTTAMAVTVPVIVAMMVVAVVMIVGHRAPFRPQERVPPRPLSACQRPM